MTDVINCPVCGKECKNIPGMKLHINHAHPNYDTTSPIKIEVPEEEVKELVVEKPVAIPDKTIADVVIPETGEVMLTYSFDIHGEKFAEYAKVMADKKGWNLVIR
jgi:hypothetical protein